MAYTCESSDDVLKVIKDKDIVMVDLRFTDLPGLWQHFSVPPGALDHDSFAEGVGFDGSSIRGFQEIQESDMLVVPDPATAFLDPFSEAQTLVLICNIRDPVSGQPYSRDPRHIAQKAETYLPARGIGDTAYLRPRARDLRLQRGAATTRAPTSATTKSMPSRRTGTPGGGTGRASVTSCGRRKGISRCRRPMPCRTSAPAWC